MIVNDALIEKLAHLSRLELKEAEKEEMKIELQKMIGFIDKLNELDTSGVEPLLHMSENVDIFMRYPDKYRKKMFLKMHRCMMAIFLRCLR